MVKVKAFIYAASLCLLLLLRPFEMAALKSSQVHDEIDRIYDEMADEDEQIDYDNSVQTANNVIVQTSASTTPTTIVPNAFARVTEPILIEILSYLRYPIYFGMSCKMFWNIVSNFARYRILDHTLKTDTSLPFDLAIVPGSSLSIPRALKAFGNADSRVKVDFLVKNLELAFFSPAFRTAFDSVIWSQVAQVPSFKELTENILMESNDLSRRRISSPELEAHRRTLILILASLPEDLQQIMEFFREYPVQLLNPSSTESCFHKFVIPIANRLALLPCSYLINAVLPLFSFDQRLIGEIVKIFLQGAEHTSIRALLNFNPPTECKILGQTYVGCVNVQQIIRYIKQFLNCFDEEMREILLLLERRAPAHIPDLFHALQERYHQQLSVNEIFHVAVLKSLWNVLDSFEDFDFSYEKDDSEFLGVLIERDPNMAMNLLNRVPRMASHKAFLLSSQFQSRHFGTFSSLRNVRIELKRTISCPEITRTHIIYIQDNQYNLFNLLLADSSDRISSYFTMNLEKPIRKRYKEHPSFTIALTTLDVFLESRLDSFIGRPEMESLDPELVLKQMLDDLNLVPVDSDEYFELAHELPSFAKALLAGGLNEEDSLSVPEAALTQDMAELELLSRKIALNRVIHDGSSLNYRLVLQWFDHFGLRLTQIIPREELKNLLKGAAFHTIRFADDKKVRFNLDSSDPSTSMTYRYAVIIIASQCKGNKTAIVKKLKNLCPGAFDQDQDNLTELMNLIDQACEFYRLNAPFFSRFKFIATNSRAERFFIDFVRHFIEISGIWFADASEIIDRFFEFIKFDPDNETLLRDHFIYFILLASFRKRN